MGSHDKSQLTAAAAADPERAVVTALRNADRAMPGCLAPAALERLVAFQRERVAEKVAAREVERAERDKVAAEAGLGEAELAAAEAGSVSEAGIAASSAARLATDATEVTDG